MIFVSVLHETTLCYTIQTLIGLFIVEEEFAIAHERHYYNLQLCAEHLPI